jgi:ADP-heptose:LPS heptosyltransferase
VLRALGLGDLLTGVPALRALRRAYRGATIELACPRALHELAVHARLADELVDVGPLEPLPESARGADVAVNLHGRGPISTRLLLGTDPRSLIALLHPELPATSSLPPWRPDEHDVARWCRLLQELGIPAAPGDLSVAPPPAPRWLDPRGAATVVHPGAASAARRWPWRRWAEVVARERRAGRRVLLTGSAGERDDCLRIGLSAGVPPGDVLAGRTSLLELAAVVAGAAVLLCGDTGVAHLATAFHTPSLVLFGPVPPSEWGPPASRPQHRALWAGRRGDPHGSTPDPGLLRIEPANVLAALHELRAELARTTVPRLPRARTCDKYVAFL